MVFIGGSVLANIMKDKSNGSWITRSEYQDQGFRVLEKLNRRWFVCDILFLVTVELLCDFAHTVSHYPKFAFWSVFCFTTTITDSWPNGVFHCLTPYSVLGWWLEAIPLSTPIHVYIKYAIQILQVRQATYSWSSYSHQLGFFWLAVTTSCIANVQSNACFALILSTPMFILLSNEMLIPITPFLSLDCLLQSSLFSRRLCANFFPSLIMIFVQNETINIKCDIAEQSVFFRNYQTRRFFQSIWYKVVVNYSSTSSLLSHWRMRSKLCMVSCFVLLSPTRSALVLQRQTGFSHNRSLCRRSSTSTVIRFRIVYYWGHGHFFPFHQTQNDRFFTDEIGFHLSVSFQSFQLSTVVIPQFSDEFSTGVSSALKTINWCCWSVFTVLVGDSFSFFGSVFPHFCAEPKNHCCRTICLIPAT